MEKIWQNPKVLRSTGKHHHHQSPPPLPQIQNLPTSPAAAIKLSRRQLAICTKTSVLLLLTSQFQYLPKARAQEQVLLTTESLNDDIPIESNATTSPTEENPVNTSSTTTPTEENSVENSETTTPTEDNPVETSGTTSLTEENPVETSDTTSPTEDNQAETSDTASTTTEEKAVVNDSNTTTITEVDSCTDKVLTKRAFLDISIDGKPIGRVIVGLYGNNVPAGTTKFSDFVSGAAGNFYFQSSKLHISQFYI